MQAMFSKIFLIMSLLALLNPSLSSAAPEHRIALVIGNSAYSSGPLKNPVNDATAMASQLQKLGFTVILRLDATLRGMEDALTDFGDRLKRGGVGLFFYAGHGLQVGGINYLVPVGAKINRESDIKYETLDTGKVLDEMANANNDMNIVILDACRDNPYTRRFRSASRGLTIVSNAPAGTFISYSTGPGNVANDGDGRNSPYTEALLRYMREPGLTIEQVFKGVRATLGKETGGRQIPWELSSLQGEFYFIPGSAKKSAATVTASDGLDDEGQKLEAERQRLEEERALFAKKKALEEKRQKIAVERERLTAEQETEERIKAHKGLNLAMGTRPSVPTPNEIKRDGRFIAYDNGTVLDTQTNLMWAAKDNGSDINWRNAKFYCESYRGGGYTDWRMPTLEELTGLYDKSKAYSSDCILLFSGWDLHLTALIRLTCYAPWASETRGSEAASFIFFRGQPHWYPQSFDGSHSRALPVRSAK